MSFNRVVIVVPLLVLALAGCVPTDTATPTPEPTVTEPSLTPNPTPTITPTPGPETVAVTLACSDVLSAQAIYDFNPNVSLLPSFSPSDSSAAGQAIAQQGLACELVNQTSGSTIDFGIVQYTDDALAAKLAAVSGSATPAAEYDGYFDVTNNRGLAQFFSAPYYVTVESAEYTSSADIAELVAMAQDGIAG